MQGMPPGVLRRPHHPRLPRPRRYNALRQRLGIQRDPKLWDDPLSFKPERFAEEKEEEEEDGFTNFKYIPFGAGRRRCPGEKLGLRMVMTVVGIFVQCFDWEPMSEEEVDMKALLGLTVPKIKPVMAKYKVRECMVGALSRV
ncbi:hypothetical protein J5N97_015700 [Dioscorea zingiberensis]|uniref:Cytochrome P450 n=1 Tax=Dioscorea zingiberensis TaxID=325984 RepID=A0A9D5CKG4_9LILI|nr:hypothetical protein J5N97_015700 [Dioscorea zingiberensis]